MVQMVRWRSRVHVAATGVPRECSGRMQAVCAHVWVGHQRHSKSAIVQGPQERGRLDREATAEGQGLVEGGLGCRAVHLERRCDRERRDEELESHCVDCVSEMIATGLILTTPSAAAPFYSLGLSIL